MTKKIPLLEENKELGLSDLLYYSTMVDSGVMLLKNGAFLSGFWYLGPDQESATGDELAFIASLVNRAFKMFDKGWMMHIESIRKPAAGYPTNSFTEPVNKLIDNERRASYETEGAHFETKHAIFFTYFPPRIERSVLGKGMSFFLGEKISEEREHFEKALREYKQRIEDFIDIFSSSQHIKIQRMTYNPENNTCGLTQALNYIINARWHPTKLPENPSFMDTMFARDLINGDPMVYDNRYVAAISILEYPGDSYPAMLHELSTLSFETRWSNRFIFTDYREARSILGSLRRKWSQRIQGFFAQVLQNPRAPVNRDAVRMVDDIDEATETLDAGAVAFGHHTSVVLVRSDDKESLEEKTRMVIKIFERKGFRACAERYNAMEALLGSFPGAGRENVRKPLINTLNLAHLVSLTTDWAGEEVCPCDQFPPNSPPLLQAAAVSSTPFRLNLHDGDVGHTLILGPTGSGKSTLLALIASQFERYKDSQIFVFDKGYSMLSLTLAMESGAHYDFAADEDNLALCPLASIDTDEDRVVAAEWIETVLALSDVKISPGQRNRLTEAIRTLAETTYSDPETGEVLSPIERAKLRSLTHFRSSIQDGAIQEALEYYTGGKDAGTLFDGIENDINYKKLTVFELDHLYNMSRKIFLPAFLFLFHEVEKRISEFRGGVNPPSLIIIDEAWLALSDEMFREKIREWLLTLRKKNCAVVLATQEVSEIIKSPICDTILDSCRTKILLPNQNARSEGMKELYKQHLGMNDRQIQILSEAIPKRQYYFVNTHAKTFRLFDLGLGPVALSFVGASGKEDLAAIRKLQSEHGNQWTVEWLKIRGQIDAAEKLEKEITHE